MTEQLLTIPETLPETLPEKMTLSQILMFMNHIDDGGIELSEDDLINLGQKFHEKIDNYHDYLMTLDAFADAYKRKSEAFKTAQKQIEKKKENLEKLLMYHLKQNNINSAAGDSWVAKMRVLKDNAVSLIKPVCDEIDWEKYPSFVKLKQSFEWDKKALKEALKNNEESIKEIASLRDSESITWQIKKP
jgi:hypothetical protein